MERTMMTRMMLEVDHHSGQAITTTTTTRRNRQESAPSSLLGIISTSETNTSSTTTNSTSPPSLTSSAPPSVIGSSSSVTIQGRRVTRSTTAVPSSTAPSLRPLSLVGPVQTGPISNLNQQQQPQSSSDPRSPNSSNNNNRARRHSVATSPRSPPVATNLSPTANRHPDYVRIPSTTSLRRESLRTSRGRTTNQHPSSSRRIQQQIESTWTTTTTTLSIANRTEPTSSSGPVQQQTDETLVGQNRNRNPPIARQSHPPSPPPPSTPPRLSQRDIRAARRQFVTGRNVHTGVISLPSSSIACSVVRSPSPQPSQQSQQQQNQLANQSASTSTATVTGTSSELNLFPSIATAFRAAVTQPNEASSPSPSPPPASSQQSQRPPSFHIGRPDSPSLLERISRPQGRTTRSRFRAAVATTSAGNATSSSANTSSTMQSSNSNNNNMMINNSSRPSLSSTSLSNQTQINNNINHRPRHPSPAPSTDSLADMAASISASSVGSGGNNGKTGLSLETGHGPMACKAEIVLEKGGAVMNMFAGPRTGISYSLPGHVVISVPNLPNGAGMAEHGGVARQRELKSLEVVFEGKSEYFDEAGRYQCMRLVQVRKSILPEGGESHLIAHSPASSSSNVLQAETKYAMAFDLAIPGWIPPTFENDVSSVSYGIICFATMGWAKEGVAASASAVVLDSASAPVTIPTTVSLTTTSSNNSGFRTMISRGISSAMSSFSGNQWATSHTKQFKTSWNVITVHRHRAYSSPNPILAAGASATPPPPPPEHTLRHFTLKPSEDSPSPVECLISVPDTVDINGPNVRIGVRIRARKGFSIITPEEVQARAQSGISTPAGVMQSADSADANDDVDMDGGDDTGAGPGAADGSDVSGGASLPKRHQQPAGTIRMVELGMEIEEIEKYNTVPAQPFLAAYPVPEDQPNPSDPTSGPHALLSPPSRLAEMQSLGLVSDPDFKGHRSRTLLLGDDGKPRSYKFDKEGLELGAGWRKVNVIVPMPTAEALASGSRRPMSEMESPYARIKHKLKIRITCRCSTMPGKDTLVVLTTPLRCGTAPPERRLDLAYITGQSARPLADLPISLPAYNQIFSETGATREDEDPLPVYEAKKEDAPPYSSIRAIKPLPSTRNRRSMPSREAMDINRSDVAGPSSTTASPQVSPSFASFPTLFGSLNSEASGSVPRRFSSHLSPIAIAGSSSLAATEGTPSTSLGSNFGGSVPPPRGSPLTWGAGAQTPLMDMMPSSAVSPAGMSMGTSGPSGMSFQDLLARAQDGVLDGQGVRAALKVNNGVTGGPAVGARG